MLSWIVASCRAASKSHATIYLRIRHPDRCGLPKELHVVWAHAASITAQPRLLLWSFCMGSSAPSVVACVATSFTLASLAEVLAAAGPVVRSGSVVDSLGNGLRTQQRPHTQRRRNPESDRRDETPAALSTRIPHTGAALHTTFTQELLATTKGGRHNVANSPKDVHYIQWWCQQRSSPEGSLVHADSSCCGSAAPYWTPHRAAPSSGPITTPLQRLSTSCHQVQSLSTKYWPQVLSTTPMY